MSWGDICRRCEQRREGDRRYSRIEIVPGGKVHLFRRRAVTYWGRNFTRCGIAL